MKRLLSLLFAFITIYLPCNAQESSLPTFDTEISREVGFFDIECNIYHNVTVNLKATKSDFFFE